jgi:hypothetical protein
MLEANHRDGAVGYSARRDWGYRRLWQELVDLLNRTPCLKKLGKRMYVYPRALAPGESDVGGLWWGDHSRESAVAFEGDVLTRLMAAGLAPFAGDDDGERSRPAAPPSPAAERRPPHRGQHRAGQRRTQARRLRDQGRAIKEIARELGCTERTVYAYLQDVK